MHRSGGLCITGGSLMRKTSDQEALKCQSIIEILEAAEIINTFKDLGNCYEKLVKEFIVNISNDCIEWSDEEAELIRESPRRL
jgi:hypothetical protein